MVKENKKPHVNVVVVGHVDAGKSTTVGHLAVECGAVDRRVIEKFEKEATEIGRASFKYAWVLDTRASERTRGITIDLTTIKIETENNEVSIIDAPGHRDFLKNMVTGAASSDFCAIVVPAASGEFEVAIGAEGSTVEHSKLAFAMGSKYPCVLVNKMDVAKNDSTGKCYDQQKFNEVKNELKKKLIGVGFQADAISFIPISGATGENLYEKSPNMPWYDGWTYTVKHPKKGEIILRGHTFYDWLNCLVEPVRLIDKFLRGCTTDVYKVGGVGTVVIGRVETGVMKPGDNVVFAPTGIMAEVRSIEMHHSQLDQATPGDCIGFNLKNVAITDVHRGDVWGDSVKGTPKPCKSLVAQVICLTPVGKKTGIHVGYTPVVDVHVAHLPMRVEEILHKINKKSGAKIDVEDETGICQIRSGEAGLVLFIPKLPVCVEKYSEYPPLGRFVIRDSRKTIGVGIIKEVENEEVAAKGAAKGGAKGGAKAAGAKTAKAGGKK